jgi:hypothetical protein
MGKRVFWLLAMGGLVVWVAVASSQPPGKDKGPGRRGGPPGGPPRFELGRVLPPFAREELNLTKDQEEEIAKLEKEVKERLEKILTADQKKRLENLRPRGPGGPPPGGPDGPPRDPEKKKGPSEKKDPDEAAARAGIQWFATWESGLREAQRTGWPILLVSAAPHCAGVSGTW